MTDEDDDDNEWGWRPVRGVDPPVWIGVKKAPRHPSFDKVAQLCREALPGAIEGEAGEFREQEEPAVVLLIQDAWLEFHLPTTHWRDPHTPVPASEPLFKVHLDALSSDSIRTFIERAREARRAEMRPCHFCQRPTPPGRGHEIDGSWVCHRCSEKRLGIMH